VGISHSVLSPEHASSALNGGASTFTGGLRKTDWALALALLAFVLGLQALSGAYHADFDFDEDEAAHVVSSLMVHDYLVSAKLLSGRPAHPWEFATNFYIHYPKVAILHWPPLFHCCEAMWMFLAGRSRFGLLSFQALLAATLVIGLFFWMRRSHGLCISFVAAIVLASTRTIQEVATEVSPDLLLAVLVFWATAQYGLYVASMKSRHAWWAALLAAGALATHGRAAVLFMVPVMTQLLVRFTKRRIAAAIAIVLVYMFVPALLGQAYAYAPAKALANGLGYLSWLASVLNWYVVALAVIGSAALFRSGQRRVPVTAIAALIVSCCIFYAVVNVPLSESFLLTAIPAMIVMAGAGAQELLRAVSPNRLGSALTATALAMLALGFAGWNVYRLPLKNDQVAQRMVGNDFLYRNSQKIWMVAGSANFEGAIIAEVALRDLAPDHIILRASKMLAHSTWSPGHYRMLFHDLPSVLKLLDRDRVGWILSSEDSSPPHVPQLEAAVASTYPAWQCLAIAGVSSPELKIFRRTEPLAGSPDIEIDMSGKFGGSFRLHE
jgi:hypothetical protein